MIKRILPASAGLLLCLSSTARSAPPNTPRTCAASNDCRTGSFCVAKRCLGSVELSRADALCRQGDVCPFRRLKDSSLALVKDRKKDCRQCKPVRRCRERGLCSEHDGVLFSARNAECLQSAGCRLNKECAAVARRCIKANARCERRRGPRRLACYIDQGEAALRKHLSDVLPYLKMSPLVLSALIRALSDRDPAVRQHLALALPRIGRQAHRAAPALRRLLVDREPAVRMAAARALVLLARAPPRAVRVLVAGLKSSGAKERRLAAMHLAMLKGKAIKALPSLIVTLNDKSAAVKVSATIALAAIGKGTQAVIAALVGALRDPSAMVRMMAASALGRLGPLSGAAALPLERALHRANAGEKVHILLALAQIGRRARQVRPTLEKLSGGKGLNALAALLALAQIGQEQKYAPMLEARLLKADRRTRAFLAGVIGNLRATSAMRQLLHSLTNDSYHRVQVGAAWSLHQFGAKAQALRVFERLCRHQDPRVRVLAARFLHQIGRRASALKVLERALQTKRGGWYAASALGLMGRDATAALAALRGAARGPDNTTARRARWAITRIRTALPGSPGPLGALLGTGHAH